MNSKLTSLVLMSLNFNVEVREAKIFKKLVCFSYFFLKNHQTMCCMFTKKQKYMELCRKHSSSMPVFFGVS